MARLVEVTDRLDPRLYEYVALRDVALRRSLETEHGLFLAEGEKVIRRAVVAGFEVRSFLLSPRWLGGLDDILALAGDVPCFVADDHLVEAVTGFHVHRGALACLNRRQPAEVAEVLTGARRVVVLEDLVDHTNVGAIFRSAAALGIDGILLSPRCADPLYRRAVKVAMGAVFSIPYARLPDWYDGIALLRRSGFRVLALSPAASAVPLPAAVWGERSALVVGAEGPGLSPHWLDSADQVVRIPVVQDVDSLNVAAAAAIACYVLAQDPPGRRRRR